MRNAGGDLKPPVGIEIPKLKPPYGLHFGRTPTPDSLERYKAISGTGMNRFDLQSLAPELTPDCWIRQPSGANDEPGAEKHEAILSAAQRA